MLKIPQEPQHHQLHVETPPLGRFLLPDNSGSGVVGSVGGQAQEMGVGVPVEGADENSSDGGVVLRGGVAGISVQKTDDT